MQNPCRPNRCRYDRRKAPLPPMDLLQLIAPCKTHPRISKFYWYRASSHPCPFVNRVKRLLPITSGQMAEKSTQGSILSVSVPLSRHRLQALIATNWTKRRGDKAPQQK